MKSEALKYYMETTILGYHLMNYIFSHKYMESLLKRETCYLLTLELSFYLRCLSNNSLTTLHKFLNENMGI